MAISKQAFLIGAGATTIAVGSYGAFYLSQDKTIRDRLVKQGVALIEEESQYQIVFKEHKSEKDFTNEISKIGTAITSVSPVATAGEALKKWCKQSLDTYLPAEGLIEKAKKYCSKPPLTIKEKFQKGKKRLVSNWETKLTTLSKLPSQDNELQADLTKENSKVTNFTTPSAKEASEALKSWCKKNIEIELISETAEATWTKVDRRCLEEIK